MNKNLENNLQIRFGSIPAALGCMILALAISGCGGGGKESTKVRTDPKPSKPSTPAAVKPLTTDPAMEMEAATLVYEQGGVFQREIPVQVGRVKGDTGYVVRLFNSPSVAAIMSGEPGAQDSVYLKFERTIRGSLSVVSSLDGRDTVLRKIELNGERVMQVTCDSLTSLWPDYKSRLEHRYTRAFVRLEGMSGKVSLLRPIPQLTAQASEQSGSSRLTCGDACPPLAPDSIP